MKIRENTLLLIQVRLEINRGPGHPTVIYRKPQALFVTAAQERGNVTTASPRSKKKSGKRSKKIGAQLPKKVGGGGGGGAREQISSISSASILQGPMPAVWGVTSSSKIGP